MKFESVMISETVVTEIESSYKRDLPIDGPTTTQKSGAAGRYCLVGCSDAPIEARVN